MDDSQVTQLFEYTKKNQINQLISLIQQLYTNSPSDIINFLNDNFDSSGQIALFYSLDNQHIFQILYDYGSNINHQNFKGESIINIIIQKKYYNIFKYLLYNGSITQQHLKQITDPKLLKLIDSYNEYNKSIDKEDDDENVLALLKTRSLDPNQRCYYRFLYDSLKLKNSSSNGLTLQSFGYTLTKSTASKKLEFFNF